MEIMQLRYLIMIVESNFNISLAAKKLYTSQSAISQMIINFEKDNSVPLFIRERGRLRALTPFGKVMYQYALKIISLYDEMNDVIGQETQSQLNSVLRVGIPELILTVYFEKFIMEFLKKYPMVRLEIYEEGSKDIARMLEQHELDFAILVEPTNLNSSNYNIDPLIKDELVAFMSENNPLAKKKVISWEDTTRYNIASFNDEFITHSLILDKLTKDNLKNTMSITSSSWNFLMNVVQNSNNVTVFASHVDKDDNKLEGLVSRKFDDPIPFIVTLYSYMKDRTVWVEEEFKNELLTFTKLYK